MDKTIQKFVSPSATPRVNSESSFAVFSVPLETHFRPFSIERLLQYCEIDIHRGIPYFEAYPRKKSPSATVTCHSFQIFHPPRSRPSPRQMTIFQPPHPPPPPPHTTSQSSLANPIPASTSIHARSTDHPRAAAPLHGARAIDHPAPRSNLSRGRAREKLNRPARGPHQAVTPRQRSALALAAASRMSGESRC